MYYCIVCRYKSATTTEERKAKKQFVYVHINIFIYENIFTSNEMKFCCENEKNIRVNVD